MNSRLPLENKTVLVTRPEQLANSLMQCITDVGGIAIHYPVIKISDVEDSQTLDAITNNLTQFDIAIFISPTAVQQTLKHTQTLPDNLMLAVIGSSTESMLNNHGYQAQIVPDEFNTESLLQHSSLQENNITSKNVVIFRGVGGRDLLGNTLTQRGANVTYAETYRREKNQLDPLNHEQLEKIDVVTVTSNQGLQNLFELTEDDSLPLLRQLPIIVPGFRAKELAEQLGFNRIFQASNATDDACLEAIINEFSA